MKCSEQSLCRYSQIQTVRQARPEGGLALLYTNFKYVTIAGISSYYETVSYSLIQCILNQL